MLIKTNVRGGYIFGPVDEVCVDEPLPPVPPSPEGGGPSPPELPGPSQPPSCPATVSLMMVDRCGNVYTWRDYPSGTLVPAACPRYALPSIPPSCR